MHLIGRFVLALAFLGCADQARRMEHPADPDGEYSAQISAARRLLGQKETWAHRAEWEVNRQNDGWEVVAWRVEHPDRRGPLRYLPWGYSVIQLDSRCVPTHYRRKG
ncbi:MAG: hypothetical protein HYR88_16690 [Verrucomicrobia bacterium]|nr:hypothetical protein [Verrucomicrobiota bacterium]MBI3868873.1 hypothetical protein [Verrucomicrobiota bacterium]